MYGTVLPVFARTRKALGQGGKMRRENVTIYRLRPSTFPVCLRKVHSTSVPPLFTCGEASRSMDDNWCSSASSGEIL